MYKVLLVEDERSIRVGLKKLIEEVIGGFEVIKEADNGRVALDWLKGNVPDLIITDIRMKEMSGLEMIERVRDRFLDLPVLIISGYSDFDYAKKAIRFGVSEYMLKPMDRLELTQYLTRVRKRLDESNAPIHGLTADLLREEHRLIRKVRELVHVRLEQEVSLQLMADLVELTPQYLSVLFKQETGQNFIDYVSECRMSRAKQLLRETNLKVYEVGALSGYANAKYFMSMFKQIVGQTPGEYREQNNRI